MLCNTAVLWFEVQGLKALVAGVVNPWQMLPMLHLKNHVATMKSRGKKLHKKC